MKRKIKKLMTYVREGGYLYIYYDIHEKASSQSYLNYDEMKSYFDDEHNYLTFRHIKNHYISEFDSKLHYYDKLFNELLEDNNKSDLAIIIDYICKRVRDNNYKDENGQVIENKYGYLKNSILSNINLLAGRKENNELWSDEQLEELINMR